MEFTGYLSVEGKSQGKIAGSSQRKDREGDIIVYDFKHEVLQPFQGEKQLGNAAILHQPVLLTKEVDQSTPKLYQALVEKEELAITFAWYRYNNGNEKLYYQMKLEKANIVRIGPFTPSSSVDNAGALRFMESIQIVYNKVDWSWGEHGDITYSTHWRRQG